MTPCYSQLVFLVFLNHLQPQQDFAVRFLLR